MEHSQNIPDCSLYQLSWKSHENPFILFLNVAKRKTNSQTNRGETITFAVRRRWKPCFHTTSIIPLFTALWKVMTNKCSAYNCMRCSKTERVCPMLSEFHFITLFGKQNQKDIWKYASLQMSVSRRFTCDICTDDRFARAGIFGLIDILFP